ncbi:hypothetical protein CRG98_030826 [Punica granatum]|uniref:Uncharacterized protein n=1 Tax=Punica granatum TaxID=22663 RepID=A0A2I0IXS5_PUNGR|nr:hypothetical protein CRG98_030826 [Punica granatum]
MKALLLQHSLERSLDGKDKLPKTLSLDEKSAIQLSLSNKVMREICDKGSAPNNCNKECHLKRDCPKRRGKQVELLGNEGVTESYGEGDTLIAVGDGNAGAKILTTFGISGRLRAQGWAEKPRKKVELGSKAPVTQPGIEIIQDRSKWKLKSPWWNSSRVRIEQNNPGFLDSKASTPDTIKGYE